MWLRGISDLAGLILDSTHSSDAYESLDCKMMLKYNKFTVMLQGYCKTYDSCHYISDYRGQARMSSARFLVFYNLAAFFHLGVSEWPLFIKLLCMAAVFFSSLRLNSYIQHLERKASKASKEDKELRKRYHVMEKRVAFYGLKAKRALNFCLQLEDITQRIAQKYNDQLEELERQVEAHVSGGLNTPPNEAEELADSGIRENMDTTFGDMLAIRETIQQFQLSVKKQSETTDSFVDKVDLFVECSNKHRQQQINDISPDISIVSDLSEGDSHYRVSSGTFSSFSFFNSPRY